MRISVLLLLLLSLLLYSCAENVRYYSQAKKHYESGNYESATRQVCRSLMAKPANAKAQDLLIRAWEQSVVNHEYRLKLLSQSSDPTKWEQTLQSYQTVQELAGLIARLPVLVNPATGYRVVIDIPDYTQQIAESKQNAAEAHYQAGIRYNKMANTRETQRKAAQEFKSALDFVPDYKDAALLYEQSRSLAIKRLAITAFEDKSNVGKRFGDVSEMLTSNIISTIMSSGNLGEYTEIIARSQMDAVLAEQELGASGLISASSAVNMGQILGAHEIVSGRILQISITPERIVSINQTAKARIVIGKEEYVDEDGKTKERDVFGVISCEYKKYTKTAGISASASFSVLDVETGKIKLQESMEIKTPWSETWCRKTHGDERALSNAVKRQMEKEEPFPPEPGEMVASVLQELGLSIAAKLRSYLSAQ